MIASDERRRNAGDLKRSGAHFTPPELADFVAARIVSHMASPEADLDVLDPACGDGELLRAVWQAVPAQERGRIVLHGIEKDERSRAAAQVRLRELGARFTCAGDDFTERCLDAERSGFQPRPRIVIANPPYVRTQVLGASRAQALARQFGLRGRVDLYHAFLVAMTELLAPDGLIGVITSNRFLTTRGGETIREELDARLDVLEVVDLGDTKLFSAAVLPAIVVGRKRRERRRNGAAVAPRFIRIYENSSAAAETAVPATAILETARYGQDGRFAVAGRYFDVTSGALAMGATPRDPWRMATRAETAWLHEVESGAAFLLGQLAKVRVGIKTTADRVFVRRDWHSLPAASRPEDELLRPLLTHHHAARWRASTGAPELVKILYPHEVVDGKRRAVDLIRYPRAARYFETHRAELEKRSYVTASGRRWYEIWVPQDPALWRDPKLVFPDISGEPRFFFDGRGALVNGDCYWISLDRERVDLLYLIQGVANSSTMARYHDLAFNNRLYAGRRRYISQYVERYPMPDPASEPAQRIVALAKELNQKASPEGEAELDRAVAQSFGLNGTGAA
jgi:tRNA1(Val) A37 N6-methylase TrmN6